MQPVSYFCISPPPAPTLGCLQNDTYMAFDCWIMFHCTGPLPLSAQLAHTRFGACKMRAIPCSAIVLGGTILLPITMFCDYFGPTLWPVFSTALQCLVSAFCFRLPPPIWPTNSAAHGLVSVIQCTSALGIRKTHQTGGLPGVRCEDCNCIMFCWP